MVSFRRIRCSFVRGDVFGIYMVVHNIPGAGFWPNRPLKSNHSLAFKSVRELIYDDGDPLDELQSKEKE